MKRKLFTAFAASTILFASVLMAFFLLSTTRVVALEQNTDQTSLFLDEQTISGLIAWGIDEHLLYEATALSNLRTSQPYEYVIGFYTSQSVVADHLIAHLHLDTYYSNNLAPHEFNDNNLQCQTAFINRNDSISFINDESYASGYDYTRYYKTEFSYSGSNEWVVAGLFDKIGTGNVILGQNPYTNEGPFTCFYLKPNSGIGTNINCANPTYETTLLGDVNNDGYVDVSDAVQVYQIGTATTKKRKLAADVNFDKQYNANDANLILAFQVGNINSFFDNVL